MAPIAGVGMRANHQLETRSTFSVVTRESTCSRCGGFMVRDFCTDLLNSTGELEFAAQRCVQCGEVVDAVIQRNRLLGQERVMSRVLRRSFTKMESEVVS